MGGCRAAALSKDIVNQMAHIDLKGCINSKGWGIKVEGILRQSADVEEVMRRVQEYEQGKNEFSPDEDAHVIGDCIKHVLREMPSSPVPASCCTALVDAYRADYVSRIDAIRDAIHEVFPEPNRRLIQRILQMMLTVAAHKAENRMSLSALAACMAPLLLRPLLAGECELDSDFQMDGDGSFQLLQAAAAANHAQAIVIIFLEEYYKIFDDDLSQDESSSELYTESEDDEDAEDDESTASGIPFDDRYGDVENEPKAARKVDPDCFCDGTPSASEVGSDIISEDGSYLGTDVSSNIGSGGDSNTGSNVASNACSDIGSVHSKAGSMANSDVGSDVADENSTTNSIRVSTSLTEHIDIKPSKSIGSQAPAHGMSFVAVDVQKDSDLHRENARKNLSMESIEYISDDENSNQLKNEDILWRNGIPHIWFSSLFQKFHIEGNAALWESLDRRKESLHECRWLLRKEVERLQEQLQKERDLRSYLEFGLTNMLPAHMSSCLDSKENAENTAVTLVADNPFKHENAAYQANLDDMGRKAPNSSSQGKQHLVVQEQCSSNEEAALERTTATVENSQLAEGNEDTKLQFEEPRSLANNQASEKGKARLVKHCSSRSSVCIAASSPEDQCSASKKNAKFGSMKKDILDSPLDNRSYQKKRISSLHLKSEKSTEANSTAAVEEKVTLVRNNATRRPAPKNEEVGTSSALGKLTNRLNFLKERRLQLASELQDLDVGRNLRVQTAFQNQFKLKRNLFGLSLGYLQNSVLTVNLILL
ncbi:hypothetical protein HPP92_024811 [Vanilla planifolia]|uniref:Rho-GAP domain-containing protein n=1 Tax=Vanilla planifolia TaxID=51239 RepID=A0A835PPR1_VANPL|nr:hypothetical protein HPP92_024811 [Vanilla planifolia]